MVRASVLGCCCAAVFAATAAAAPRFATVEETDTLGPNLGMNPYGSQVSQIPACRGSRTPVSGGFETEFRLGDPATPAIFPTTFRRDQRKWYAGYANYGLGSGTVTTFAYCSEADVSISFVPKRATGPVIENTAACSSDAVALAGGYVLDTGRDVPFALHRASKRTWTTSVTNPAGAEAGLTAYVVCGKPKRTGMRPKEVGAEAAVVTVAGGSTATARAVCPSGRTPASGGFSAPPGTLVHESKRFGKRAWEVSVSSPFGISGTLTAYAYCV